MIPSLLALALAAAAPGDEPPLQPDREVVFMRGSPGGWSTEGRTVVNEGYDGRAGIPATEPTIGGMYCAARRNGIMVAVNREGGLGIDIEGSVIAEGRRRQLRAFDLRALLLDGVAFETQMRSRNDFTERFTDVAYAAPELGPTAVRDRQLEVRRASAIVWLPVAALADNLLRARMLRLGFREAAEDPEAWDEPMIWVDVPLEGLGEALSWCQRAMATPDALRLHPPGIVQPPAPVRQ